MGIFGKKSKIKPEYFKFSSERKFQSKQRDDFGPEAFTFRHANILMTIAMAKNWLGDDECISATKFYKDLKIDDVPDWVQEIEVHKSLIGTDRYFEKATRIGWSESKIGKKFQEQAQRVGALTHLMPCPQDLSQDILTGNWKLCDGTTLIQMGEVWRDNSNGKEFIYWHIDALVRTRPPLLKPENDLATKLFIPYIFQSASYLSESPFPSTPIVMKSREAQFGYSDKKDIPKIAIHTENNCRNFGTTYEGDQMQAIFLWTPQITRYGYIFEEKDISGTMDEALITVFDALPKVGDILADGYCNWGPDSELSFQASCFADRSIFSPEEYAPIFIGEYVPGSIYAELDFRALHVYNNSYQALYEGMQEDNEELVNAGLSGFYDLMNYGCGSSVGHSVNALIFAQFNNPESFLGEKSEPRYQEWLHDSKMFLNFVTKFDIDFQNANAYSNLASIHIDEGEFAEAQKCVTAGLHILETANPNKSVSLLWDSNPKAILPIKLELMMHQVSIYMEKGEKSQANKLAKEIGIIANENDYDDGNVLAASYVLSQSDTGKPRN